MSDKSPTLIPNKRKYWQGFKFITIHLFISVHYPSLHECMPLNLAIMMLLARLCRQSINQGKNKLSKAHWILSCYMNA